jgi:hypothetical protein
MARCTRFLLALMSAFAVVTPALAQVRPTTLSDSQEPGSVIVFPKFINGATIVEFVPAPQTEIEVGVVCPKGVTCTGDQSVNINFHWVCPGPVSSRGGTCNVEDFMVTATVNEKAVFSPDGVNYPGVTNKSVGAAPCPGGYLIGWVVDNTGAPIKFDGLIGDAVLRLTPNAVSAYNAIPIQAEPSLANGAVITLGSGGALLFDGGTGHYQAITGSIKGDVKYPRVTGSGGTFNQTSLTLLTLDVQSNRPTNPEVFVDFDFFGGNPSVIGNEQLLSATVNFVCWGEFQLNTDISSSLVNTFMGRKGVFVSAPAADAAGNPLTLLGLVLVHEGPFPPPFLFIFDRSYITGVSNDSVPVPTSFVP